MFVIISNIIMVCLFVYLGIFFVHLLKKTQRIESQIRYYHYGILGFFITYICSQFLFILLNIFFEESNPTYDLIYIIGNFISEMGLLTLMFVVEKYIYSKFRFIPTILILILAILEIILHEYVFVFTLLLLLVSSLIPIIYFRVAFQTIGSARIRSLLLGLGLIIFMLGIILNTYFIWEILIYFAVIAPFIEFTGVGIFHYALLFYGKSQGTGSKS